MHKLVSFNYQILPRDKPTLKAISSSSLYGRGVFTTLAIYSSKPFLWEKHWRRLCSDAIKLEIDLSKIDKERVEDSLHKIVKENAVSNGRCRITLLDGSASKIWKSDVNEKTCLLIQTADARAPQQNISLFVSQFQTNSASPLAGVKSCNYLENLMAIEDARLKGFDQAVLLNENGEVTSACMANIFWQKDKKLFTPSLKTGCLRGTTREFILEQREVFEVEEFADSLDDSDAIFLTSSGIGIVQVGRFREKEFSRQLRGLTRLIGCDGSATTRP